MATVRDLLKFSLVRIGVLDPRQDIPPADATTALAALNALLDSWRLSRLFVYAWTPTTFALVPGQASYTLGPTGNWVISPRPQMLDDYAYVRADGYDYPIQILSGTEYSELDNKSLSVLWPQYATVIYTVPNATITFWPLPSSAYNVTLRIPSVVGPFASVNDTLALAPGYELALSMSLAEDLAPGYGRNISPLALARGKAARDRIKRRNLMVPMLDGLEGEDRWNIFSNTP